MADPRLLRPMPRIRRGHLGTGGCRHTGAPGPHRPLAGSESGRAVRDGPPDDGGGLVEVSDEVRLTEEGRHLAAVVVRRHRLAERFLSEVLKLPWAKVHEEAEVWETMISDDVEKAMWAAMDDPKTCPHGNPIPGAGYRLPG